jgi:hypothetical protein
MMQNLDIVSRWDGSGWRWWALAGGVALVILTVLLSQVAALLLDERTSALLLIGLLGELVVLSFMGSGMLKGTTRRMSRGGLQRETATLDTDFGTEQEREVERARDRERQDRRTIRCGIMALPVFLTVLYLLFQ